VYNNSAVKKITNFEGNRYEMSFIALIDSTGQGALPPHTELARVTYTFDRSNKAVKRAVATAAEGLDEDHAKGADILEGIEDKDSGFEYCYRLGASPTDYEYEWKDEWQDEDRDKGRIPRGVKVSVGEYSKIIFIPTGYLGGEK
jgi:hypothetical protein